MLKRLQTHMNGKLAVVLALVLIGLFVTLHALTYEIGSLRRMGAGYFPLLLGIALCVTGVLIAFEREDVSADAVSDKGLHWRRGALFVLAAILLFAVLIRSAGFAPATFLCVLIAGMADRRNRLNELILLASGVTIMTSLAFVYGLGIPVQLVAF